MTDSSSDPYPIGSGHLWTALDRRFDRIAPGLRSMGYEVGGPPGQPKVWDRRGVEVDLEQVVARIRADRPDVQFDVYQSWMDVSRQGY